MADVILVQPTVQAEKIRNKPVLPIGLLSVASYITKDYDVKIIDQRIDKEWKSHLLDELSKKPLVVGVTTFTGMMIRHALEISEFVKENSDVPVCWGGVHPSMMPEQTLRNRNIDIIVEGEGEATFRDLLNALKRGRKLSGVKGLWYKENGKIIQNPKRELIDMDDLPDLPYNLVDVENYVQTMNGRRSLSIQTSRGCVFKCSFCYNNKFNRGRYRAMSAKKAIKMVEHASKKFGIEHFVIQDDSFFVGKERNLAFLEGIKKFGITWETEGTNACFIDAMDQNYLNLLRDSGCVKLYIAAESASTRILKIMRKPTSPEQVLRVNRKMKGTGICALYNFLGGIPTETDDDLRASIKLALQLLKENPNSRISGFFALNITPGTAFYDDAVKTGKLPKSIEEWANVDLDSTNSPWIGAGARRNLKFIYFLSRLMDDKYKMWVSSKALQPFFGFYKYVARFRLRYFWFGMPVELKLYGMLKRTGRL